MTTSVGDKTSCSTERVDVTTKLSCHLLARLCILNCHSDPTKAKSSVGSSPLSGSNLAMFKWSRFSLTWIWRQYRNQMKRKWNLRIPQGAYTHPRTKIKIKKRKSTQNLPGREKSSKGLTCVATRLTSPFSNINTPLGFIHLGWATPFNSSSPLTAKLRIRG